MFHMSPTETSASQPKSGDSDRPGAIELVLVDDHPTILSALRGAVEDTIDMRVVAECSTSEESFQLAKEHSPDVIVVDLSLDDGHGFDVLENIRAHCPDIRSLVFSMYDEKVYAERALRAGASGYLMKAAPPKEVIKAVRTVHDGEVYLSEQMTRRVLKGMNHEVGERPHFPIDEFTDRELQVFQMLGQGLPLSEISDRLDLARKTVETYRRRAKEKLGVESGEELVAYATRWTLAQPTEKDPENSPDSSET